jgi:hypothetical protein
MARAIKYVNFYYDNLIHTINNRHYLRQLEFLKRKKKKPLFLEFVDIFEEVIV